MWWMSLAFAEDPMRITSSVLPDLGHPTKDQLLAAMEGQVLAPAERVGTYRKR